MEQILKIMFQLPIYLQIKAFFLLYARIQYVIMYLPMICLKSTKKTHIFLIASIPIIRHATRHESNAPGSCSVAILFFNQLANWTVWRSWRRGRCGKGWDVERGLLMYRESKRRSRRNETPNCAYDHTG